MGPREMSPQRRLSSYRKVLDRGWRYCKVTGGKVGAVPTALVQVSHLEGTGKSRPKDGLAFTGSGKVHRTDSQDPWTNPSIGHLKSLQLQPRFVEVFSFIIVDVLQSLCFMYVVSVLLLIDLRTCAFAIFDCCPQPALQYIIPKNKLSNKG